MSLDGFGTRNKSIRSRPRCHCTTTNVAFPESTSCRSTSTGRRMRETTSIHVRTRTASFSKTSLPVLDLKKHYTNAKKVESGSETDVFGGIASHVGACIIVQTSDFDAETTFWNISRKYIFYIYIYLYISTFFQKIIKTDWVLRWKRIFTETAHYQIGHFCHTCSAFWGLKLVVRFSDVPSPKPRLGLIYMVGTPQVHIAPICHYQFWTTAFHALVGSAANPECVGMLPHTPSHDTG